MTVAMVYIRRMRMLVGEFRMNVFMGMPSGNRRTVYMRMVLIIVAMRMIVH